jgi:hypothetical protein
MKEFKPIAMRCNQQQYAEIKQILIDNSFKMKLNGIFDNYPYLVNNNSGYEKNTLNISEDSTKDYNRTVFETWDKDIFLEYCGIETKKPELTELPNVWSLKITQNNIEFINKIRLNNDDKLLQKPLTLNDFIYISNDALNKDIQGNNVLVGIEITTEQFKKWVLKETTLKINTQWMPQIGDWVFTDMCNVDSFSKETCVKVIRLDPIPDEQPNFMVEHNGHTLWCYPSAKNTSFVRKAEPHEIPKSKIPELFPPDYVEAVRNITGIEKGKIYPFVNGCVIDGRYNNYEMHLNEGSSYFKPSTKEAFDAQIKVKKPDLHDLLIEATKRYPIGSTVICLTNSKPELIETGFTVYHDMIIQDNKDKTRVYKNGNWAEIIPTVEPDLLKQAELKYPVGTQFIPAHVTSGINVVTKADYYWEDNRKNSIMVTTKSLQELWSGCLYKNGKWAEILEPAKPVEIKSKYQIAAEEAIKKFSDIKIGDLYITNNGDMYEATRLPEINADSSEDCYIDCGPGYLWEYETPHKVGYKVIKPLTPIEATPIVSLNDLYENSSMFHALDYKETLKEIQPTESITNQLLNIKLNNY